MTERFATDLRAEDLVEAMTRQENAISANAKRRPPQLVTPAPGREEEGGKAEGEGEGELGTKSPADPDERRTIQLVPLDSVHEDEGRKAERELLAQSPDAGADERLLLRLVARSVPTRFQLEELEAQVVRRATILIDNPATVLTLAKVARELVAVTASIQRRMNTALTTASALRAQRRFLSLHERK
jgi:hypothetical protein